MKELVKVQAELKAPKNMYNSFGKYRYRSCELILEAAKPLYTALGCYLTLSDELITREGAPDLILATAKFTNCAGDTIMTHGYGAIDYDQKGMDASKVIGSASSYARKYALNGLFAVDDSKDADTDESVNEVKAMAAQATAMAAPVKEETAAEDELMEEIETALQNCYTMEELETLWNDNKAAWQKNKKICAAVTHRKKELTDGAKQWSLK